MPMISVIIKLKLTIVDILLIICILKKNILVSINIKVNWEKVRMTENSSRKKDNFKYFK